MRDIKFNAYIEGVDRIIEGVSIHDNGQIGFSDDALHEVLPEHHYVDCEGVYSSEEDKDGIIVPIMQGEEWVWMDEGFVPLQYTGFKDSEGKPVFEGDRWQRGGFIGIVTFKGHEWAFEKAKDSNEYQYPYFSSNVQTGKVIGCTHLKSNT